MSAGSRCPQSVLGAALLSEMIEGTLPPPRREELERHLAGCAACRGLLEELRVQIETCRRTPRPAPSRDCVARAVEALQAELARRQQRSS